MRLSVCLLVFLTGCGRSPAVPAEPEILAIGDSIFRWHARDDASVPDVIGEVLGRPVVNASVSGAWLALPTGRAAPTGADIRRQYARGRAWDWVVLDGGANDLNGACRCEDCAATLDGLITADGEGGEIAELVRAIVRHESRVLYVGYHPMPDDAQHGFSRCDDELAELDQRVARMAEAIEGAWSLSMRARTDPGDRSLYAEDRIHPSPRGSRRIGEAAARVIERVEGR